MLDLSTSVLQSDAAFKSFFGTFAKPNGSPMSNFCGNATPALADCTTAANQSDWNALRQYLMDVVDARVTSPSASASPVPSSTSGTATASVNFGAVTLSGSSGVVTFTVQSARATSITLNTPTVSGGNTANFIVGAPSCTTVAANYGNSCTFTVQFVTGNTDTIGGAKSTTLLVPFSSPNAGDPTPATRRITLQGYTNIAPVANAGGNQSVAKNATVTLNGTGSSDANNDPLTYAWTVTAPGGGGVSLGGSGATRTFTASQVGTYSASLTVNDGSVDSVANTATISVANTAPTAASSFSAGSANAPTLVTLSSAGSSDPNGDAIAYLWAITSQPVGSAATLSSTTAAGPTFTATKSGTYRVTLAVSDGAATTNATPLDITLGNTAPTANAGIAQSVTAPVTVNLSGSGTDANGDTLGFAWAFTGRPIGSTAALSNANTATPTFNADKSGAYVVQLTVTDGNGGSTTSTVTITAANTAPTANAGGNRNVTVSQLVTLAGSGTDANGDTLSYSWALAKPGASGASLSNATTATPSFTPDVAGTYTATLTVNDGHGGSTNATAVLTALVAAVANAGPAQLVNTGGTVTLDGSASTTSAGSLSYAWTLSSRPAGSAATLAGATTVAPTFVADLTGSYVAQLQVTDSLGTSPIATVTITADRAPVANAGSAQNVIIGDTVTLDGTGSSDADGDVLTYQWSLTTRPPGSAAALSSLTASKPTFSPDIAGSYAASLVVNDGKLSSSAGNVSITANNPPPVFTISAATLSPTAQVTLSTTVSAVIGNSGGLPLTLSSLAFTGSAAADYALAAANGCTAALVLAPGSSCTLVVSFAPSAPGSRAAILSITHNAAGSPSTLTLNGTGTPRPQGRIALSTFTLAFADTQLNSSTPLAITVQNTGDLALGFTSFDLAGTNPADFARSGTCSTAAPLAIGAQCTLTLTFAPTGLGPRSATLTIQSDASNGPSTVVTASGTGVPIPVPVVTLSNPSPACVSPTPSCLDFGQQTVGGVYPSRSVTLTNSGAAALVINAIAIEGTGFAAAGANTCPASLAAGASCSIPIGFSPVAADTDFAGLLRVTSNAAGSPHTLTLRGRGTAATVPVLVWQPAVSTLEFGAVAAGVVSATQTATLLNQGPGGATLTLVNAVGANAAAFSVGAGTCQLGAVLFQGDSCTIDARFAPGSAGDKTAAVQVASSGSFPSTLMLHGTGLAGASLALSSSVSRLDFPPTTVGTESLPLEVTLTNTGSGVVQVSGLQTAAPFVLHAKTCASLPFSLQPLSSCTVTVTYAATAEGSASGLLRITSDADPATIDVALAGNGTKQAELGGGGCTLAGDGAAGDPTLWGMVLLALGVLARRRATARQKNQ